MKWRVGKDLPENKGETAMRGQERCFLRGQSGKSAPRSLWSNATVGLIAYDSDLIP